MKVFSRIKELGCTHFVCVMTSQEQKSDELEQLANRIGLSWSRFPIQNGILPSDNLTKGLIPGLIHVANLLSTGEHVIFCCNSGILRSGAIVYVVLKVLGHSPNEIFQIMNQTRSETASGLQAQQQWISWAEECSSSILRK